MLQVNGFFIVRYGRLAPRARRGKLLTQSFSDMVRVKNEKVSISQKDINQRVCKECYRTSFEEEEYSADGNVTIGWI